jgi:hypothetical protein
MRQSTETWLSDRSAAENLISGQGKHQIRKGEARNNECGCCGVFVCKTRSFALVLMLVIAVVGTYIAGTVMMETECSLCSGLRIGEIALGVCAALTLIAWVWYISRRSDGNDQVYPAASGMGGGLIDTGSAYQAVGGSNSQYSSSFGVFASPTLSNDGDQYDQRYSTPEKPVDPNSCRGMCCVPSCRCCSFWLFSVWTALVAILCIAWLSAPLFFHYATTIQEKGTLILPGLQAPVRIQRESNGLIHILV